MVDRAVLGSWRTASMCSTGACVEVLLEESSVRIRDSKLNGAPDQPSIEFGLDAWGEFLDRVCSDSGYFSVDGASVARLLDGGVQIVGKQAELRFDDGEWTAFRGGVAAGEFTLALVPSA